MNKEYLFELCFQGHTFGAQAVAKTQFERKNVTQQPLSMTTNTKRKAFFFLFS